MSPRKSIIELGDEYAREVWPQAHRRRWGVGPCLWATLLYIYSGGLCSVRDIANYFGCSYKAAWTRVSRLRCDWLACEDGCFSIMEQRREHLAAANPEGATLGKLLAIMPPAEIHR